jgi:hypothetical protein
MQEEGREEVDPSSPGLEVLFGLDDGTICECGLGPIVEEGHQFLLFEEGEIVCNDTTQVFHWGEIKIVQWDHFVDVEGGDEGKEGGDEVGGALTGGRDNVFCIGTETGVDVWKDGEVFDDGIV